MFQFNREVQTKTVIPFVLEVYSQHGATLLLAIYHLISNAHSWNNC